MSGNGVRGAGNFFCDCWGGVSPDVAVIFLKGKPFEGVLRYVVMVLIHRRIRFVCGVECFLKVDKSEVGLIW